MDCVKFWPRPTRMKIGGSSRIGEGGGGLDDVISIWRSYLPGVEPGISR